MRTLTSIKEGHSLAETTIPPALPLKSLIASYSKLDKEDPSSWLVWSDNENLQPVVYTNAVCHTNMRFTPIGYDHLVTAVPKSDKVSLSYLRMLIHGPFRAMSDLIHLVLTKDGCYLQCSDLKRWPAPVLFNFCVASRVPIEFQNILDLWVDLLEDGYPDTLAFLLSHSTGGQPFKAYRQYPQHGHFWFDPSSDWRLILDGKPDLSGPNYHQHPGEITPSNVIWGKSYDYEVVRKLDDLKAAEFYGFKHPPKKEPIKRSVQLNEFKKIHLEPHLGVGGAYLQNLNQWQIQVLPNGAIAAAEQPPMPPNWGVAPAVGPAPVADADNEPDFDEFPNWDDDDNDNEKAHFDED